MRKSVVEIIVEIAEEELKKNKDGLTNAEIIAKIREKHPNLKQNTIEGYMWQLQNYSKNIKKPKRGIYVYSESGRETLGEFLEREELNVIQNYLSEFTKVYKDDIPNLLKDLDSKQFEKLQFLLRITQ